MAEPFLGEINFYPYKFTPKNWMPCDGRLLSIMQYQALYSLLGTQFGGDGVSTFALPDLRGRAAMHPDESTPQGTKAGEEDVTLTENQIPQHNHSVTAHTTTGTLKEYDNSLFAAASGSDAKLYAASGSMQPLSAATVSTAGGSQPHPNCQPSLVGNYCIAVQGIFPSPD
ncbi:phage tail protein [Microbulbifer litoralis]|uniref:phage tail protein n=1 Tax=Microbulbifer litoralis TaxID=2933965 RepID=UPI0020285E8A|nr:tail fiber protein [Microbulbifer sp. GX H0434]